MKRIPCVLFVFIILLSLFGCKTKKPDEQEPYIPAVESDGVDKKQKILETSL